MKTISEYYEGVFCVEAGWLYGEGRVMSKPTYDKLTRNNQLHVVRRGCRGNPALVSYDSLPDRFKKIIVENWGDLRKSEAKSYLERQIKENDDAMLYFMECNDGKLKDKERWKSCQGVGCCA